MIVFDLLCAPNAHVFEAWFGSTEDYESQKARGLLSCPICGVAEVGKALMAPRVAAKGNQRADQRPVPVASAPTDAEPIKAMMRALAKAQAKVLESSEYVGGRFAEEARAIHLGETPDRPIYGQATVQEAKALHEDGIPVAPLPLPVRAPGTDN